MATTSRILPASAVVEASCSASEAVGDCVYIFGDRIGAQYQVRRLDPRVLVQTPAVGVIDLKLSATACLVRLFGPMTGIYSSLLVQTQLWVGLDGRLTANQAGITALPGGRVAVQQMGVAFATDTVMVMPQAPIIRLG